MESISNMATAAAQAVWPSNNTKDANPASREEPRSGFQGDTAKGEPYDAGNIGEEGSNDHYTTEPDKNFQAEAADVHQPETSEVREPETHQPEPETHDPLTAAPSQTPAEPETKAEEPVTESSGPAAVKDSSTQAKDSTKAQNDVRDPSDPQTHPDKSSAAANVDDSGEGPNEVKVDGPGPKPIADVARQHGGDAGQAKEVAASGDGAEDAEEEEDGDGPQKKSHGSGTGEQYVKSSGLVADGGDFDAANPGAGREADRLLEEKGMHRAEPPAAPGKAAAPADEDEEEDHPVEHGNSNGSNGGKKKRSLGEKIKAKMHRSSNS